MPKQKYKDVVDGCKELRRKELETICKNELNDEEFRIFMLRVYNQFYRERVSTEVGKCKESISKIFMRAVRKMRQYFKEKRHGQSV
jgi:DNA-directed RNA polymerase specialized sigma24 family protein